MHTTRSSFAVGYWLVTLALFIATIVMLLTYTPIEKTMGPVQMIFYIHLPVAINTFIAALVVFIASAGYLWQRKLWWDDLAAAAGKVTVLFTAVVLLTGILWGKAAWWQADPMRWWAWTPRLTFSLVLFLLYVVYLMIRPAIESPQRRAVVSAVYGMAAFLDVPLVYLSVKLIDDIHPPSISLEPPMKLTLLAWFIPITLLMAGTITARFRLNRRLRAFTEAHRSNEAQSTVASHIGDAA